MIDGIMMRGLSINRDENYPISNYKAYEEADDVGLQTFTPLYLT
jgi:hypothetical protein